MKHLNKIITIAALLVSMNLGAQNIEKWKLADLEAAMKNADQPVIFNFWATFCKPCIEELPYFQEIVKKYQKDGVKLVLVSLDLPESYPKKISLFAARMKLTAPIRFLDETDADLFCPAVDESWMGSIPASLFINNKTGYRRFYEDQLSKEEFEQEVIAMMALK